MPYDRQESLVGGETADSARTASHTPPAALPEKRLFNVVELRLFRYTAVLLSLLVLIALVGGVVWIFAWLGTMFFNLLFSLAISGVLALVLHPVVEFLKIRLHLPRLLAISIVLVLFFVGLGGLIFLLVPVVLGQLFQLMIVLPETLENYQDDFSAYFPQVSSMIAERMESGESEEANSGLAGMENAGKTIMSYLGMLASVSFVPLFLFFALLARGSLRRQASEILSVFQKPTQQKVLYFIDVFVGYITAFFQGQLLIAVCMGTLYAMSFTLIGLNFGVLIGLILGLLNIVPFLGSLIGLLVVLPMAYLQPDGGVELMVLAGLVFAAVQLIESWLLTPKIMANRSGLHPALVVISLFFWGTAFGGILGMILAVPLTAFFVAIWGEIKASLKRTLSNPDDETS